MEEVKTTEKSADNSSAKGFSCQACKDEMFFEGQAGLEKKTYPFQKLIEIKNELCDSIWDGLNEKNSKLDVQLSQLVKQENFPETLLEPTRNKMQIKEENEGFEIIDVNIEDTGLHEDRPSLGNAACSKLSGNDVQTSQKEATCGKRANCSKNVYKCEVCGRKFIKLNKLIIHIKTHIREKSYKCDVCGKECSTNSQLIVHKRTHTGEKPYKCDVCGKGCNANIELIVHKRTHTGKKPYKCDVCGKGCSTSSHLIVHKRTHTGEKPYKCDVCGKGFNTNNDLIVHKRTHTGEKHYKCDVCGKECSTNSQLIVHKRTHTGEKPYKCDVCGKECSQSSQLKSHKRTHKREKQM